MTIKMNAQLVKEAKYFMEIKQWMKEMDSNGDYDLAYNRENAEVICRILMDWKEEIESNPSMEAIDEGWVERINEYIDFLY